MFVSAPYASSISSTGDLIDDTGAVYYYEKNEETSKWTMIWKLVADDASPGALFGFI